MRVNLLLGKLPIALGGLGQQPVRSIEPSRGALLHGHSARFGQCADIDLAEQSRQLFLRKPLTDIQHAKRLKDYGIKPKLIRLSSTKDDVASWLSQSRFP
jgi:hypothetical protein